MWPTDRRYLPSGLWFRQEECGEISVGICPTFAPHLDMLSFDSNFEPGDYLEHSGDYVCSVERGIDFLMDLENPFDVDVILLDFEECAEIDENWADCVLFVVGPVTPISKDFGMDAKQYAIFLSDNTSHFYIALFSTLHSAATTLNKRSPEALEALDRAAASVTYKGRMFYAVKVPTFIDKTADAPCVPMSVKVVCHAYFIFRDGTPLSSYIGEKKELLDLCVCEIAKCEPYPLLD